MCKVSFALFVLTIALAGCTKAELASRDAVPQVEESAPVSDAYVNVTVHAGGGVLVEQEPKAPASEDSGFRFPDDHAGALLARTLPPSEMRPVAERASEPQRRPGSARVEAPSLPLPASHSDLPRVAIANKHAPQPHLVLEDVYFATHAETLLPAAIVMAAAERVRVPSVDVNQPIPLPILAKPATDRVPLDDVTIEASTAAALSGAMPTRTKPAPFMKLSQPDPFENRKQVAPPVTHSEEVPNTTPVVPKR